MSKIKTRQNSILAIFFLVFFLIESISLAQSKDIKDIKPPLYPKTCWILFLVIGIVLIIGLAFLLYCYFFKKRKEKRIAEIKRPAHELAFERLRIFRDKNSAAAFEVKEYYIQLSDIARHYIEDRFLIRAPEMTTEEFLVSLKTKKELFLNQRPILRDFLVSADMVKFACYSSTQEEMEKSFQIVYKFIEKTSLNN